MRLRHIALYRWNDAADDAALQRVVDGLASLPARIPELLDYRFGADLALAEGNWDFAVVADVADEAAYAAYRDHPAHQAVAVERIVPLLAARAAVQLRID